MKAEACGESLDTAVYKTVMHVDEIEKNMDTEFLCTKLQRKTTTKYYKQKVNRGITG